MHIHLLGLPRLDVAGVPAPGPRGRKAWALLALLLLSERPPSRQTLAQLLFADADDPLAVLRWNLSQLRRALAGEASFRGDPVVIDLAVTCRVDVHQPGTIDPAELESIDPTPPERLLEGLDGVAGPDFDLWLTAVRHRYDASRAARLRGAAARAVADGAPALGVMAAVSAALIEKDDPATRGALIDALAASGDHRAALDQLRQWTRFLRRELHLRQLLTDNGSTGRDDGRPADLDVAAHLEVGSAALGAGSVLDGLNHLRTAVRLAARRRDERLQARTLCALGSSVVHGVAAHSPEGADALREAARLGRRTGDTGLVAEALRDLAFVANAGGRVQQARRLLDQALDAAGDDRHALSSVRGVQGMFLADRGQHARALVALRDSARLAEAAGHLRQAAWSTSFASRSLLLRRQLDAAQEQAEHSHQLVVEERWTTMLPWVEALLGELDLVAGRVQAAERRLRHAWSTSLVLGDWTWQGMAARGLGLVAFAGGDADAAMQWLTKATHRATAGHDRNPWVDAFTREALCRVSVAARLPRAGCDVQQLSRVASSTDQPHFAVSARAYATELAARRSRSGSERRPPSASVLRTAG